MQIISRATAAQLGLKRYFTGRPCPHGHLSERFVSCKSCLECHLAKRPFRRKYPDRKAAYNRVYAELNQKRISSQRREYRRANAERIAETMHLWGEAHKEWKREYNKTYRSDNRDHIYTKEREWRKRNADRVRLYMRVYQTDRSHNDPCFKLSRNLRRRTSLAIVNGQKAGSGVRDLGASIEVVRAHIERMFTPKMTWENWGTTWELDHIRPIASFNMMDREKFLQAAHYLNLRPLLKAQNRRKKANLEFLL